MTLNRPSRLWSQLCIQAAHARYHAKVNVFVASIFVTHVELHTVVLGTAAGIGPSTNVMNGPARKRWIRQATRSVEALRRMNQ